MCDIVLPRVTGLRKRAHPEIEIDANMLYDVLILVPSVIYEFGVACLLDVMSGLLGIL